jgi:methylase of polypeptide subunit release factors
MKKSLRVDKETAFSEPARPADYRHSHDLVVSIVEFFFNSSFAANEKAQFFKKLEKLSETTDSTWLIVSLGELKKNESGLSDLLSRKRKRVSSVFELAYLHETTINKKAKKKDGVFYTPQLIAERIVKDCLSLSQDRHPRVLDPACGAGIFLLQVFRELYEQAKAGGFDCAAKIISEQIFGIDIDPLSIELASLFLKLECLTQVQGPIPKKIDFRPNLFCGNFLIDQSQTNHKISAELETPRPLSSPFLISTEFDIIVGNPPYGLSRAGGIDPKENALLRQIYSNSISGKVNKYLLFIVKSYSLLAEHGLLSFIIPNAWLGIKDGKAIRELLLRKKALKEVTVFESPIFDNAGVETVIFTAKKSGNFEEIILRQAASATDRPDKHIKLPISHCLTNPDTRIPAYWYEGAEKLLTEISAQAFELQSQDSPFKPMIALQAYSVGKGMPPQTLEDRKSRVFHSKHQLPGSFPYLQGKDVDSYRICWSGVYLQHGPFLAEPQTIERFLGPRVIVREILKPAPYVLAAAFSQDVFLYNKSLLHIIFKSEYKELSAQEKKNLMLALAVILNSKVASAWILLKGIKSQRRLFPKILREDLAVFPLPACLPKKHKDLSRLAKQLMDRPGLKSHIEVKKKSEELFSLRAEADAAVHQLYGLESQSLKLIDQILEDRRNKNA